MHKQTRSWKPEVFVEGGWSQNQLAFATQGEAMDNARSLSKSWTMVCDFRAAPSLETPNYVWRDGKLAPIAAE